MFQIIPYLSFLTSGLGIFFIFFLTYRYKHIPKIFWLISIIFSFVYIELYNYALVSKHILHVLFLFRSPNIVRAFLPICLLFYVRSMIFPNRRTPPIEYLHFLFPLIVIVGVLPDLLLSDVEKVQILNAFYLKVDDLLLRPIGFFPPAFLQPVSMLLVMTYSLFALFLIFKAQFMYGPTFTYVNKHSLLWMKLLSLFVFIYFGIEFVSFYNLYNHHVFNSGAQLLNCILGISLFCYFISSPNVQENMDGCIVTEAQSPASLVPDVTSIFPTILDPYKRDSEAIQFEAVWQDTQCYLNPACDVAMMAKQVALSPSKFSSQLKKYYGISYAEFSNRLKIYYFLTHVTHFDQYTLETYIYQSGFSNRSTFYAAFKKYVGVNPSFYLKELKYSRV